MPLTDAHEVEAPLWMMLLHWLLAIGLEFLMEPFDLDPFVAFMKSRGLPPERTIPYYAAWVRRYLQTEMPGVIADITDKIRFFCEQLSRKEGVQDCQIEQARRAIELHEAGPHPGPFFWRARLAEPKSI